MKAQPRTGGAEATGRTWDALGRRNTGDLAGMRPHRRSNERQLWAQEETCLAVRWRVPGTAAARKKKCRTSGSCSSRYTGNTGSRLSAAGGGDTGRATNRERTSQQKGPQLLRLCWWEHFSSTPTQKNSKQVSDPPVWLVCNIKINVSYHWRSAGKALQGFQPSQRHTGRNPAGTRPGPVGQK